MGCFAVIRVDQYDGEYVDGVECLRTFPTEQLANDHVKKLKDERQAVWKKRMDYIEAFVDAIELPETDYHCWVEYLKQYHPFGARYVSPKEFKEDLKGYLRTYSSNDIEGYDPPAFTFSWNTSWFDIEIKDEEA